MEYNNIHELISKVIAKSDEALLSAEFNFSNKHYETCQNRLYYAIFYIVSALAYKDNFITSKHAQLMGWFNKKYIYDEKIFDSKLFAIYKEVFEGRQKSDYDFMYLIDEKDIYAMIEDVKLFINEVKNYLEQV